MHTIVEQLDRTGRVDIWAHLISRPEAEGVVRLALSAHDQHVSAERILLPVPGDLEIVAPAWRFTVEN